MADLNSRTSNLKSQISNLASRISNLESRISNLKSQIRLFSFQLSTLDSRDFRLTRLSTLDSRLGRPERLRRFAYARVGHFDELLVLRAVFLIEQREGVRIRTGKADHRAVTVL